MTAYIVYETNFRNRWTRCLIERETDRSWFAQRLTAIGDGGRPDRKCKASIGKHLIVSCAVTGRGIAEKLTSSLTAEKLRHDESVSRIVDECLGDG